MLNIWENLYLRIRQVMALRNSANRDLSRIAANHPPIIDALEKRDLARAVALVSEHSRSVTPITREELGIEG
jgi:DNA-binding GntR family transcriptional regulator